MKKILGFVLIFSLSPSIFANDEESACLKRNHKTSCLNFYKKEFENKTSLAKTAMHKIVDQCLKKHKKSCEWIAVQNEKGSAFEKNCVNQEQYTSCAELKFYCEEIKFASACKTLVMYWVKKNDLFMTKYYLEKGCFYGDKTSCDNFDYANRRDAEIGQRKAYLEESKRKVYEQQMLDTSNHLIDFYSRKPSNQKIKCKSIKDSNYDQITTDCEVSN